LSNMTSAETKAGHGPETVPAFGYELIREAVLSDMLGKDAAEILYWAGKRLARKYPLESMEAVIEFFENAGWGNLAVKEEKRSEMELQLSSPLFARRFKENPDCTFQLEAGFLAQQLESQKELLSEAFEHPKKRGGLVLFTVKWDKKDRISPL
jgi:predicted hydrocarbon binding protein